jgi:putative serine protease PepD
MTPERAPSLRSNPVEPDDGLDDDGPFRPLLPPDDRLWRHPSEIHASGSASTHSPVTVARRAVQTLAPPRVWAVALVAGVVGALTVSAVGMLSGAFEQQTTVVRSLSPQGPSLTLAADTGNGAPALDWASVDDAIAPSVVAIQVSGPSGTGTGSGTLMVDGGKSTYIITDSSLVADGGSISVSYLSGRTVRGQLVRSDPVSGLALVAVPSGQGIFPVLGSAADLQDANPVLAVGARGWPGAHVFAGLVSGEDRQVDTSGGMSMQDMIAIQSAQVPAAAAGGPVVDDHGRVVGVTLALDPTDPVDQNLTFAVPIDVVKRICQEMLDNAPLQHPWLGVTDANDLSSAVANQLHVSGGAQVGGIWPGSPASHAGLKPNDIIISFNGAPVTSTGALTMLLAQTPPGKAVPISYIHDGTQKTGTVVITNQPDGDW